MAQRNSTQEREIEYRRQCVKDTWIKLGAFGTTQQQITDALKDDYGIEVDRSTVSGDLKAIKKAMQAQTPADLKSFLMAEYLYVIGEARAAWQKSLEDAVTETQEAVEGDQATGKQRLKVSTRREGQSGNPALLAQAQAALKAIREMFGVDAAQKLELGGSIDLSFESSLKKAYNGDSHTDPDTP